MSKAIDYKKFIDFVHQNFEDKISKKEVEKLLSLEEDYNKDSPASLGKSLCLNRLIFKGEKNNGDVIDYDKTFDKGLNIWIADNGKGKSTIFKIIKYALTGRNKLKPDIKRWVKEIILEFQIGQTVYTVYVNKSSRVSEGDLYSFSINDYLNYESNSKLDTIEIGHIFSFKGDDSFMNQIQGFFFNQFSFYSLKYTQKSSKKDDPSLKTSNLSWGTYFKTIYLESKEHSNLYLRDSFGAQGSKIFEMILGLRLTYPINRLELLGNREDEEIGKLKLTDERNEKNKKSDQEGIKKELSGIIESLKQLEETGKLNFNTKPLIEEQLKLQNSINLKLKNYREASQNYNKAIAKRDKRKDDVKASKHDLSTVQNEITRLQKQILEMNLYQEAGSFFTNLEIKTCPHCETTVADSKIIAELETHDCRLCGTKSEEQKVDDTEIQYKIEKIETDKTGYENKLKEIQSRLEKEEGELKLLDDSVIKLYNEFVKTPSIKIEESRLEEIEKELDNIKKTREGLKDLVENRSKLLQRQAVLQYQLDEVSKTTSSTKNEKLIKQHTLNKEIIKYAINKLKLKRQTLNEEILTKLEGLILRELHEFGLKNISKVSIGDNYNLIFTQNEETEYFDDLTESEKLRAKFAFYLSLIQLDIEFKLGRHPRFLIFDSPGSEEISKTNLEGLSTIFKEVNNRFGDHLQIFLGTTLIEFSDITSAEKATIKGQSEVLF